jgi:hypothetical protein
LLNSVPLARRGVVDAGYYGKKTHILVQNSSAKNDSRSVYETEATSSNRPERQGRVASIKCPTNFSLSSEFDKLKLGGHQAFDPWPPSHSWD